MFLPVRRVHQNSTRLQLLKEEQKTLTYFVNSPLSIILRIFRDFQKPLYCRTNI